MVKSIDSPRAGGQSKTSQAFLVLILVFGFLSLCLNLYLSIEMGSLKELSHLEHDLMRSFTKQSEVFYRHKKPTRLGPNNADEPPKVSGGSSKTDTSSGSTSHLLAGLQCEKYGGPSSGAAQEMVYWEDIESDNKHVSPFQRHDTVQYLSFEPDEGGWNNIRMNMETVLAMAFAMGRTLVLPPAQEFYLLSADKGKHGKEQEKHFGFSNFFHMESIHNEHVGLNIISMQEYLEAEAIKGHVVDTQTGQVSFPPNNRTNWDGSSPRQLKPLYKYLRSTSHVAIWVPEKCLAAFPATANEQDTQALIAMKDKVLEEKPRFEQFVGKPVGVDAPAIDRMRENWADRKDLCLYNASMQAEPRVHFPTDYTMDARLLVHFYAFLFFQDWKQDLWMKRFVRDHVRYIDEIQCAAARVVEAIREHVRKRTPQNTQGDFDTFHVRRGDFQYKVTRIEASEMYDISKSKLTPGDTVYIATDERDKSFFNAMKEHYDVVFLDDFMDALGHVNTNYYGMIDQLVASRGRVFFGCWFSTFTAYINRLRGYHADNHMEPGYTKGIVNSYYYALADRFDHMLTYYPVKQAFYAREFPTSWRLIDYDIDQSLSKP